MAKEKKDSSPWGVVKQLCRRWFVDALGAMALGLFSSLIIGLIISQLAKIPGLGFFDDILRIADISVSGYNSILASKSPVIGAAIGVAIASGLKHKPLVVFSSAATGAAGYVFGGPVGAYLAALVGAEVAGLIAGRTKVDIIIVPFVTIIVGGVVAKFVGPGISSFMTAIGNFINWATTIQPILMGIIVSVVVGMALTAPISSAALCIMLGLDGLAAGAATVGCCANMLGFAIGSFPENGIGGFISQGIGTSMLQVPNIVRRPVIWLPSILTSAILGPFATTLFAMTNNAAGAGMGTSGLVGNINTYIVMTAAGEAPGIVLLKIALIQIILPLLLAWGFTVFFRRIGWIKKGDMKLPLQE